MEVLTKVFTCESEGIKETVELTKPLRRLCMGVDTSSLFRVTRRLHETMFRADNKATSILEISSLHVLYANGSDILFGCNKEEVTCPEGGPPRTVLRFFTLPCEEGKEHFEQHQWEEADLELGRTPLTPAQLNREA